MKQKLERNIRIAVYIFVIAMLISGLTAFPLEWELTVATTYIEPNTDFGSWIHYVADSYRISTEQYPFIAYGTDWLAFAHILFAVLFLGIVRDPVRNKWVVEFGLIACVSIIPLALIAGGIREIPFFWQCIDMSFGFFGAIPLAFVYQRIIKLEQSI
jgi:hypothetical protein